MAFAAFAQPACDDGYSSLIVSIQTDTYGYETSWQVSDNNGTVYYEVPQGTYANNTLFETQVCVPDNSCVLFQIEDSFGDGIFSPGFYMLVLNGDTLAMGNDFDHGASHYLACEIGQACSEPDTAVVDSIFTTLYDNHWYIFEPDSIGMYEISTCGINDCDTKIWIYDSCDGNGLEEDNAGTILYDDNETDCAPQAVVVSHFVPGETYLLRIGDSNDDCVDSLGVQFNITYQGEVVGCTDPTSCNYNPLATIDDGSCLPQGDPDCPEAPDLLMRQDILTTSIYLTTRFSDDECLIEEGCMNGYGERDIVRFSTHIDNIGELDYYIGQPTNDNSQFTWDNCHNHYHYDGYAEYVLFDEDGNEIPIGFKNGFCVLDLGCTTGSPQFGCGNMGISAGCYDAYGSGLRCQWIDITDVPDGRYTFVTRVNWDNAPDRLGRVERDTLNNWAQVCILLDRSSGALTFNLDPDCPAYVDCEGTPYGSAQMDCAGECGGSAVMGDLDFNGMQEIYDAQNYVGQILSQSIIPTTCNDLSGEGEISVYDASLLANCLNYGADHVHQNTGPHDHCRFPAGVTNVLDTVSLSILDANFEDNYIDIGIKNPSSYINAYQFKLNGLMVMEVENLVDESLYPITPYHNFNETMVIGISYQDSVIQKSGEYQPLCRVHYAEMTNDTICLEQIIDVVNHNQERLITKIDSSCVVFSVSNLKEVNKHLQTQVIPNPFSQETQIQFSNPHRLNHQLDLMDSNGRLIRQYTDISGDYQIIKRENLSTGIYFYKLSNEKGFSVGKISIQ